MELIFYQTTFLCWFEFSAKLQSFIVFEKKIIYFLDFLTEM